MADRASPLRTVALVCGVALLAGAMITGTWEFSRDRIAANERARLLASLNSVSGVGSGTDLQAVPLDPPPPGDEHVEQIYAMLAGTQPAAWVYVATAPQGYNGPIEMLAGVRDEGTIIAVRVLRHRETPGLGDAIETGKSDWIEQFVGTSLTSPANWAVSVDGGDFDAITGATITPRAVVAAIAAVLEYHRAHEDALRAALQTVEIDTP